MTTLPQLHARHRVEERALIREALKSCGWSLAAAARALDVKPSSLQYALESRHPKLDKERRKKGPGPGAPRHDPA